jgi:hypothetical protein
MELPRPLANLINYANAIDGSGSERLFQISATIITPTEQIPLLIPTGMAKLCLFGINHSDDVRISAQLQPGVYQTRVLPYRDNLYIEVVRRVGLTQTVTRYRAIPQGDADPTMIGTNTAMADLTTKDEINMVTLTFQLLDPGFAILRNAQVSDHLLMCTLRDALHYQLTKFGETLNLTGADAWRGVDIEEPMDNERIFGVIVIPPMSLVKLAEWMQNDDKFGFYSKAMGSYYRKGMWYVYPLLKIGRYEQARKVVNIYRLPEDVFPTLKNTWFVDDKVLTILATGGGDNVDGSDVLKLNKGSGKRVISSDAVMGEVGRYYARGQALTTRQDSLSEYKTSERGSGEEVLPFHDKPTNNLCKLLSQNAYADGSIVSLNWHNSDIDQLVPGMPCRFYFMHGSETLMYREGTVISARGEAVKDTQSVSPVFREHAALELFISNQTVTVNS